MCECFVNNSSLNNVIIPDHVIGIGNSCFSGCESLAHIQLSTNLTKLKDYTFNSCSSLKEVILPPYLKIIGRDCFRSCEFEKIELPTTIESIEYGAFNDCSKLTSIDLSKLNTLTKLEQNTFSGCLNLKEIILNDSLKRIDLHCFNYCTSLERIVIPSSVTIIGDEVFNRCKNLKELLVLNPNCIIGNSIIKGCTSLTKIQLPLINGYSSYIPTEDEAHILATNEIIPCFIEQKPKIREELHSIELPDNEILTQIYGDKNTSIYIPSTITFLDYNCFDNLSNLKELLLPSNIYYLNSPFLPFNSQSLQIKFTNGKTSLDENVNHMDAVIFEKNGIHCKNIVIDCDSELLNERNDSNFTIIYWDENNEKMKTIPSNIVEIDCWRFLDESITSLTIPSTVTKIEEGLSEYDLPNLGELTCYKHHVNNCHLIDVMYSLTKIEVLDGNLDDILVSYRYHSEMKKKGILLNTVDSTINDRYMYENELPSIIKSIKIYSPKHYSLKEIIGKKFEIRQLFDLRINIFEIPYYQTKIYDNMFQNCRTLSSIILHENVKEIGNMAFSNCDSLKIITIPSSVTSIGKNCFLKCSSLTSIDYDGEIDGNCLIECTSLKRIPVIKSLEPGNFDDYRYLKEIKLNDSIEKIPTSCFNKCLSLETIIIPTQCTMIDLFVFKHCISLRTVSIPKSVEKINSGAFYGCYNLEQIEIENEHIEMGYDVFGECKSLKEIIINGNKINKYPFEVNYSQMKQFKEIEIECTNIVIRREDVKKYGIKIINDERVHRIHDNCFRDNMEIVDLVIPTHITQLGMFAFSNCQNITKVIIPSSVTTISYCCFEHCNNLKEIELPKDIELDWRCFTCCKSLSDKSKERIPNEFIEEVEIEVEDDN